MIKKSIISMAVIFSIFMTVTIIPMAVTNVFTTDFTGNTFNAQEWKLGFAAENPTGLTVDDNSLHFKNTTTGDGCYFGPLISYDDFEVTFDITKCNNDASIDNVFLGLSFGMKTLEDYYGLSTSTIIVIRQDGNVSVTKAAYGIDLAKNSEAIVEGYQMEDIIGKSQVLTYRIIGKPGVIYLFYKKKGDSEWNKNVAVLQSSKIKTVGFLKFTTSNYPTLDLSIDNITVKSAPVDVILPTNSIGSQISSIVSSLTSGNSQVSSNKIQSSKAVSNQQVSSTSDSNSEIDAVTESENSESITPNSIKNDSSKSISSLESISDDDLKEKNNNNWLIIIIIVIALAIGSGIYFLYIKRVKNK